MSNFLIHVWACKEEQLERKQSPSFAVYPTDSEIDTFLEQLEQDGYHVRASYIREEKGETK